MKENVSDNNQTMPEDEFFISLKNDFAFTQIMKNTKALRGFLSAVLGVRAEDILEIKVEDRYLKKESFEGKLGILDVRASVVNLGDIDIEIQVQPYKYWKNRSIFYTSKMYIQDVNKGEGYVQCQKVIHIAILGFNLCEDTDYFYSSFHLREDERNTLYSDMLEYHVIELGKLGCTARENHVSLHKWACLINAESEEQRMGIEKDPYIEEVLKELEELSRSPERRAEYEVRDRALRDYITQMDSAREEGLEQGLTQGMKQGLERGLEQGIEQGIEQGKREVISNAIKLGMTNEQIYVLTGIPEKRIEEMRNHP